MPLEIFKKSSSKPSLKSTMLLGAVATALIVFVVTLITASQIFTRSITQQGVDNAHVISRLTFDNMYQIMSQGWNRTELLQFREDLQKSYQAENLKVWIYRANLVNQQFGELPSVIPDDSLQQFQAVAHNASAQIIRHDNSIRLLEPIKATEQCIACHTQAKKGDVLGVMAIEQDIGLILKPARFDFVFLMLLLLPIPMILAWWVGKKFSKSLLSSVNEINKEILSIHQIDDLSKLTYQKSVFDYLEFEQLQGSLNQLGQKIKNIAIDRDILDFEIQLLDKLILSSEIIKDWKQHICQLMMEINRILPLYALFVVFRTDDAEHYVIEFFWLGRPSEEAMEDMQKFAQKTLADVSIFEEGSIYKMNHTFASQEPMDVKKDIQTQSKSLMLDHPRIGGVVGLGVETLPPKESSRSIVVESILTTLINVIGSIKAINKFTKELEYYATRDPLTHLFNQRVFHEMLSYEIRRSEQREYSFGLLMIDFDNFKLINDQYGHAFGDDVLIAFANKIKEAIRQGDIFARYGGDEFCVILPESDENIVREIGQKILDATDSIRLQTPQNQIVKIACSIGASLYPDHAQNKEDLFMVADNMLYRVKDHGKNALSYPLEPDLIEVYKESNDQSTFIMSALETGEAIEAHYQPIVSLHNGEVQVHELLMRLRQDGELISASRFIETAEHMGLVNQMDLLLIEKALKHIHNSGYAGSLFINLSPKAIVAGKFIQQILDLTQNYQISPERIVFEITERETVHNISLLEKFVVELRSQGFRFAIDDFGSGFSSFQYLKRLPVDFIKIEGEFINNMSKNKIDYAFVESAVSMAKTLGIKTVAEFIENEETLRLVKELDMDYAQGFLLATPQAEFKKTISPHLLKILQTPNKG